MLAAEGMFCIILPRFQSQVILYILFCGSSEGQTKHEEKVLPESAPAGVVLGNGLPSCMFFFHRHDCARGCMQAN